MNATANTTSTVTDAPLTAPLPIPSISAGITGKPAMTTAQTAINAAKVVALALIGTFAALVVFGVTIAALTGDLSPKPAPAVDTTRCWNEPNAQMPGGFELIQGSVLTAPTGSVLTDCPR